MTTAADRRGWGPGWPTNRTADMAPATGGGVTVLVHRRIAGLVSWLLTKTAETLPLDKRADDWGYACRPIRGSRKPSNHSWGLAVDLNAVDNPMGSARTTIPAAVVGLWEAHGFDWGGRWNSRPDPMHFEFAGTPADADRISQQVWANAAAATQAAATSTPITPTDPTTARRLKAATLAASAANLPTPLSPQNAPALAVIWLRRALNTVMPDGPQLDENATEYTTDVANHVAVFQTLCNQLSPGSVAGDWPGAVGDRTKFMLAVAVQNAARP